MFSRASTYLRAVRTESARRKNLDLEKAHAETDKAVGIGRLVRPTCGSIT